jgi:hypothetical protein
VQDVEPTAGALRVECDHENIASSTYRQELCYRRTQRNNDKNHLHCDKVAGGVAVPGHTRRVGAPHVICGTAGLNESRIHWADGYHDDFEAYSADRNPTDGSFILSALNKGLQHGKDLLTAAELHIASRMGDVQEFMAGYPDGGEDGFEATFEQYLGKHGLSSWDQAH